MKAVRDDKDMESPSWFAVILWVLVHILIALLAVPAGVAGFVWAILVFGFSVGRLVFAAMMVGAGIADSSDVSLNDEDKDDEQR